MYYGFASSLAKTSSDSRNERCLLRSRSNLEWSTLPPAYFDSHGGDDNDDDGTESNGSERHQPRESDMSQACPMHGSEGT